MAFYYSTQPYLAWVINKCFYNGTHRAYVAACFYTYRLPNPKSSNPFLIYQDLYHPWKDQDDFDKFILQTRLNIRKGVHKQFLSRTIGNRTARRLKRVCDRIEATFFYPIVYRVDIQLIDPKRFKIEGSGVTGSHEYLIEDLNEGTSEFEVLFLDFLGDPDFDTLKNLGIGHQKPALLVLEGRCKP